MSAIVLKPGLLDTIQDNGRYGNQHYGINPGGAMDIIALSVANILVSNNRHAPILELHFPASIIQFTEACIIALSGADFGATVNEEMISLNMPFLVPKDAILKFIKPVNGARCYLAISGGWKAAHWLDSFSTNTKIALGGYQGRALKKGDILDTNADCSSVINAYIDSYKLSDNKINVDQLYNYKSIRCTVGSEFALLTEPSKLSLFSSTFKISNRSDRMGFQLDGSVLELLNSDNLLSSAVTKGTIQLLPSGTLIVLMADHQTTGGYPKILQVITADISSLAQKAIHENVEFCIIDLLEAEDLMVTQNDQLNKLEKQIQQLLN